MKYLYLAILTSLISAPGLAATKTASMQSNATVNSSCVISADDISFGDMTATGSPSMKWATGNVRSLCTRSANYSLQMGMGNHVDANNYRQMKASNSNTYIKYTVCKTQRQDGPDSGWGSTVGCVDPWRASIFPVNSTGTGFTQIFPVNILAQKNYYRPDTYTDTMTVTLVY